MASLREQRKMNELQLVVDTEKVKHRERKSSIEDGGQRSDTPMNTTAVRSGVYNISLSSFTDPLFVS